MNIHFQRIIKKCIIHLKIFLNNHFHLKSLAYRCLGNFPSLKDRLKKTLDASYEHTQKIRSALELAPANKKTEGVKQKKIDIGGKIFSVSSVDAYVAGFGKYFEPNMVALFKKLVKPQAVVADIGANVGLTAMLFSQLSSKVVAFEPSPSTYQIFTENLIKNNVTNVIPVNFGLGDELKSTSLTFAENNRSGGYVSDFIQPEKGHTTELVEIKKLDDVWHQYADRLDFIKIDVEGFEGHVLRGGSKIIQKNRPIVVLELNHWCLNVFRHICLPDFLDLLRNFFPYLYAIDFDNTTKNLHDKDEAFYVMHEHVVKFRYLNIAAGFDESLKQKLFFGM